MESTTHFVPQSEHILEPEYIAIWQAEFVSGLKKSSLYGLIKYPENKIRTRAFSTSKERRKKVRLINFKDLLAFLDILPADL